MKPSRLSPLLFIPLLAAALSGCVSLKPAEDPTQFYVLSVAPTNQPPPDAGKGLPPVSVATVETPAYLDNASLVVRRNNSQLDYLPYQQWAEPVRDGITRCLREALAASLGAGRVNPLSYRRPAGEGLEVQASVSRFEFTGSGQAVLAVRWLIVESRTGKVLHAQSSELARDRVNVAANPDLAVRALSETVAEWSGQVAGVLQHQAPPVDRPEPLPTKD